MTWWSGTSKDVPLRRREPYTKTRPLRNPAEAEVLDLEVLLDAVLGPLAAETALLHAAERRHLGRDEAGVDAHHAALEPLGHAEHARHVAPIEIRGEPELGVVSLRDGLVFRADPEERRHRAERLFL